MLRLLGASPRPHRTLAALVTGAVVTAAALPAGAQPVTLTFNTLTPPAGSDVRYVANCYTESGFTLTATGLGCGVTDAFATGSAASPLFWTGSPALFLNNPDASSVDITSAAGARFSIQSIGLAPFLGGGGSVLFTGFLAGGGTVTQTFNVPGTLTTTQLFSFSSAFTGLVSLRMAAMNAFGEPYMQFDNISLTPAAVTTPVPEPTTVVLMFGGLAGVGLVARRVRPRTARHLAASADLQA